MSNNNRNKKMGFCLMVLLVGNMPAWAEVETILPPGSVWEYTSVDPTGDPTWNTTVGDWATGPAPFGNASGAGVNGVTIFNYNTWWPEDTGSGGDDFWVRTLIDLTDYDLSTISWELGVDNEYTLYINGDLAPGNSNGWAAYTYRWEYYGTFPEASLDPGINVIAVALNDRGGATAFDMQVTGTKALLVNIPDSGLEAAIREALSLPTDPIRASDLEGLTSLDAYHRQITDLTGLEYCINLESLSLSDNLIRNINVLSGLTNLSNLDLGSNDIRDIQPLVDNQGLGESDEVCLMDNPLSDEATSIGIPTLEGRGVTVLFWEPVVVVEFPDPGLEAAIREALGIPTDPITETDLDELTRLEASRREITDLTGLEYCMYLVFLDLSTNNIKNIGALSDLVNLQYLYLDNNNINDISPLSELEILSYLRLGYNNISDISVFLEGGESNYYFLSHLYLNNNNICDISPLSGLPFLHELSLDYNYISDIQPLVDNPLILKMTEVDLRINPLSYKAINTDIPILQDRGVTVHFFVPSAEDMITSIEHWGLPSGSVNPLIAQLKAADRASNKGNEQAAIKHLTKFMDRCEKMNGTTLIDEEVRYLITTAQSLIDWIQAD